MFSMLAYVRRLIGWKDLSWIMSLGSGYVLTTFWPRKLDRWILDRFASLLYRLDRSNVAHLAAVMEWLLAPSCGQQDWMQAARKNYYMQLENRWGCIRDLHRHGWEPNLEVEGLEHIRHGLAAGRGVILWGMSFGGLTLPKEAFSRLGIPLIHLSRENHGAPSKTWLGKRLGSLARMPEVRHLARRIVIPSGGSLGYMRDLMDALRANSCVSILGENTGRRDVVAPFFEVALASAQGAPGLAWKMGSELLICYVMREDLSDYRVVVERVPMDRALGRKAFVRAAIEHFTQRLQERIRERPADWMMWTVTGEWWYRRRSQLAAFLPQSRDESRSLKGRSSIA